METTDGPNAIGNGSGEIRTLGTDTFTSATPAVRGLQPGHVGWSGADEGKGLARFLGWFSVGLGVAQVLAPSSVARLVGLRPTRGSSAVLRLAGLREIAHGAGILSNPRPKEWVGTRIGGDALDLALLGVALVTAEHRERALLATVALVGVTALDVLAFQELSESRALPGPDVQSGSRSHLRRSITIGAPPEQVYGFWRTLENLPRFMKHLESVTNLGGGRSTWTARGPGGATASWEAQIVEDRPNERIAWRSLEASDLYNEGSVDFLRGPDSGTVVRVEMRYAPPGGRIGAAMLRLLHREPGQQIAEDLRRLKQIIETGEVVESDATLAPDPHPAQPRDTEQTAARSRRRAS